MTSMLSQQPHFILLLDYTLTLLNYVYNFTIKTAQALKSMQYK
jgi:hypothetical protein